MTAYVDPIGNILIEANSNYIAVPIDWFFAVIFFFIIFGGLIGYIISKVTKKHSPKERRRNMDKEILKDSGFWWLIIIGLVMIGATLCFKFGWLIK